MVIFGLFLKELHIHLENSILLRKPNHEQVRHDNMASWIQDDYDDTQGADLECKVLSRDPGNANDINEHATPLQARQQLSSLSLGYTSNRANQTVEQANVVSSEPGARLLPGSIIQCGRCQRTFASQEALRDLEDHSCNGRSLILH